MSSLGLCKAELSLLRALSHELSILRALSHELSLSSSLSQALSLLRGLCKAVAPLKSLSRDPLKLTLSSESVINELHHQYVLACIFEHLSSLSKWF
ncbi:hypothetical protein F2Q68_00011625 [Brassica cretica]|uniref:Uncharacterized protein n=1 Tax=Brassica cretica TaxID=69181 RepID=A0A8S9KZ98_BRACR|nr:hypothetical protein F2Q68_00011625 [Brassica cretica]